MQLVRRGFIRDVPDLREISSDELTEELQARAFDAIQDIDALYELSKRSDLTLTKVKKAYVMKCKHFFVTHLKKVDESIAELSSTHLNTIYERASSSWNIKVMIHKLASEENKILGIYAAAVGAIAAVLYLKQLDVAECLYLLFAAGCMYIAKGMQDAKIPARRDDFMTSYRQWATNVMDDNREVTQEDVQKDCGGLTLFYKAYSR